MFDNWSRLKKLTVFVGFLIALTVMSLFGYSIQPLEEVTDTQPSGIWAYVLMMLTFSSYTLLMFFGGIVGEILFQSIQKKTERTEN